MKTRDFASDREVEELVAAFEAGTIGPTQFDHAAHMAAALLYLSRWPLLQATTQMRSTLLDFTTRHGVNVYHETVTGFWMRLLDHLAEGPYRQLPLWSRINLIVKRWERAGAMEAHYSRSLIASARARREWVPPDLLPLPF